MHSLATLVIVMMLTVTLIGPVSVALSLISSVPNFFVWLSSFIAVAIGVGVLFFQNAVRWWGLLPIVCAGVGIYLRFK